MLKEFEAWLCGNWVGTISKEQQRMFCSPSDCVSPSLDSFEVQTGKLSLAGLPWMCYFPPPIPDPNDGVIFPPPAWQERLPSSNGILVLWSGAGSVAWGLSSELKVKFHETRWLVMPGFQTQDTLLRRLMFLEPKALLTHLLLDV